jgi:tetratricopeptide (TPR) repeat protein
MGQLIDCETALDPKRNKYATWKKAKDRLIDEVWPILTPSFQLHPGTKVFTIGSCFARNIEEHLHRLGFEIPMLDFRVPQEEWGSRPSGLLNKYTPPSIFQEVEWAKKIYLRGGAITESDSAPFLYECKDGLCIDCNLSGFVPVSRSRFFARRREIYEIFKELFNSGCVVVTLGLIEAWFDREKGIYIQEAPIGREFAKTRGRFAFECLTHEQCRSYMQKSVDAIRAVNKEAKFLITTSPVPLIRTFTDRDVIVANMQSKSVLRAVAGDIAEANADMDYFPSYESVNITKSWNIWSDDLMHVSDLFVAKVVSRMTDAYCSIDVGRRQFLQSYMALKDQELDSAVELGRQAVESAPENADSHKLLAYLFMQKGDMREAEIEFEKAIELDPTDSAVYFQLSQALDSQGRSMEAILSARRCIELAPDNEKYRRHLAQLWFKKKNLLKAIIEMALLSAYRCLRRTKSHSLKRFLRFVLPQLRQPERVS